MSRNKKSLEDLINEFLEDWDSDEMVSFLKCCGEVFILYDVDENDDWVSEKIKSTDKEELANIRLIRTIYLVSKMADKFAGRLCLLKSKHPKLWEKMEKCDDEIIGFV